MEASLSACLATGKPARREAVGMPGADAFNQCAGPDPGRRDEWLAGRSRWGTKCTRIRREYEENTNGIRTKNDSNTLARRMYPACTWPALPAEQGIHSAAKPQPNGRRQNHGRTESYLTDHAAPPFVVPPAMILSLFRMILSCHDSVGLLRDKKSSQPANKFDYCSPGVTGGVGRVWGVCALGKGDGKGPWHKL
jgi:hypothetical protein